MYECLQRVMGGDMTMVNMIDGQLEFFKGGSTWTRKQDTN
jgi:hypothetical protein